MRPDDFWNSTFDEVLLVIKGKVYDWRYQRLNAWKIVEGFRGSKDMPALTEFYGLPYDDEIAKAMEVDPQEALEQYNRDMAYLNTVKWN